MRRSTSDVLCWKSVQVTAIALGSSGTKAEIHCFILQTAMRSGKCRLTRRNIWVLCLYTQYKPVEVLTEDGRILIIRWKWSPKKTPLLQVYTHAHDLREITSVKRTNWYKTTRKTSIRLWRQGLRLEILDQGWRRVMLGFNRVWAWGPGSRLANRGEKRNE